MGFMGFMDATLSGALAAALRAKKLPISRCSRCSNLRIIECTQHSAELPYLFLNDGRCHSLQLFTWGDESNYCTVEKVQLDHKANNAHPSCILQCYWNNTHVVVVSLHPATLQPITRKFFFGLKLSERGHMSCRWTERMSNIVEHCCKFSKCARWSFSFLGGWTPRHQRFSACRILGGLA